MKYKLIGIRPNHAQMRQMVGKTLYSIYHGFITSHIIIKIEIGEDSKWKFVVTGNYDFPDDTPLFASIKSAKRYAKKNGIKLD